MKFSTKFKKSFSYTWYLYLIAIVLPATLFPLSYSFMHRAKQYETLSIFVPCYAKEGAEEKLFEDLKSLDIRKTEVIEADYLEDEITFAKKISVVAYNRCDLIVLPEEKLGSIGIETAALELTSEVKELCNITTEKIDESGYGVELPKTTTLNEIANLKEDKNYYVFLAAKSLNIGDYSNSKIHTENAFKFMQYVLGK